MRRLAFILILSFSHFLIGEINAQVKFATVDYDAVLKQMPEYTKAQEFLADLKAKYDKEATRGEEEFQKKFSDFLQGQKEFPENILVKRQAELQTLMEAGIKFRKEAQQLLKKAESESLNSVKAKLNDVINTVGTEGGYAFVLNTSKDTCPFVNPAVGDDVTKLVLKHLGIQVAEENNAQ